MIQSTAVRRLSRFALNAMAALWVLTWAGGAQARATDAVSGTFGLAGGSPASDGLGLIPGTDGIGFAVVYGFSGAPQDGASPNGLLQGSDGMLYGTTLYGGSGPCTGFFAGCGTVFRMAPDGSGFTLLHSFTGNASGFVDRLPNPNLIQGPDGTLYGTTGGGGSSGAVFRLHPDGTGFALLHTFGTGLVADGLNPYAGLIQGPDGTLYGTTSSGDSPYNGGTVFRIAPDGSGYAVLHSFNGTTEGGYPLGGLLQTRDGALYGTTSSTVFRMAPDGSGFAVLHSFSGPDGFSPRANLIQGPDGTLYGTTSGYNPPNRPVGTVFKIAPDGSGFAVLHSFPCGDTDCANPEGSLVQTPDGTLYGTTVNGGSGSCGRGCGTVFQVAPDGSSYALVHSFTGFPDDAANPYGSDLIQASDGTLYGTASQGGLGGGGVVFQLSFGGSGIAVLPHPQAQR